MISRFFIDRPIFASVLSIVITLAGAIALFALPLALYPPVSPPNVSVDCNFPGASAQVVSESVATPIEQYVNGVENMLYMSSQCTNDGTYNLTVTFKHGVDLNMAQVMVQNRVSLAMPLLPDVIKATGVTTRKRSPDILMAVAINSPEGRYDQLYLSNYAAMHIKEEVARLPGVGDISMLGQRDYSMRIWLDPEKLSSREPDRRRRRPGGPRTEPPGRDRPDRPASDPAGTADPVDPQHPRPAGRARGVRRHHHQVYRRGPDDPDQGRRPGRAGGQESRYQLPCQPPSLGQHRNLPASRRQRPRHGRHRQGQDRRAGQGLSARLRSTRSVTTPRHLSGSRSSRSSRPCARR